MNRAHRTFVSYSRTDAEFALKLARDLRGAGQDIWLDQLDIPPGARWDREVEQSLKVCRRILLVLSPASSRSENVQDEIGYAFQHKKLIIPVLHEACDIPLRLLRLQYIDFTKEYDQALQRLLSVMKDADQGLDRVTGTQHPGDTLQPGSVVQPQLSSTKPAPGSFLSFRSGLAVAGGTLVVLILMLLPRSSSRGTPSLIGHPCAQEGSVHSRAAGAKETLLRITNKRSEMLKAYWLDFEGKRMSPIDLSPGETVIRTLDGHFYAVTRQNDDCITLLEAPGSAVVE